MQTKVFTYDDDQRMSLICGLFCIGLSSYYFYSIWVRYPFTLDLGLLLILLLVSVMVLIMLGGFYMINNFLKLHGKDRIISISEESIKFPEYADSLNVIELDFSAIEEVYFGVNRYEIPNTLVIKYEKERHANIGMNLKYDNDFEDICDLFKLRLGLTKIETKTA